MNAPRRRRVDAEAKARQGTRTDLADIVEKIPQSKSRDAAGKAAVTQNQFQFIS